MKTRIFLIVLTAALLGITPVLAQENSEPAPADEMFGNPDMQMMGGPDMQMIGGPGMQMMKDLKLTDEQKKEVEKLHLDMAKQMIAQEAKVKTAGVELLQLFRADNPDKSAIEKKVSDISQLQAQAHLLKVNHWFAVNKLLTPEQQKIWKDVATRALLMHGKNKMDQGFRGPVVRGQMLERMHGRMMQHEPMGK